MYLHKKQVTIAGTNIGHASKALILIHGRGSNPGNMLALSKYLHPDGFALFAPEAENQSWYPYSFMEREESNQPALDSALDVINQVREDIISGGIKPENIYLLGFSQGACLALEFAARNATEYGGIIAFTGGLIGEHIKREKYQGNFRQTPVLMTTGDPDAHVPPGRVNESRQVLQELHALTSLKIFKGRSHSVSDEEIRLASELLNHHRLS